MDLLLGFLPLIVFCTLARLSLSLALWLALGTAFALGTRWFVETGRLRLLDTTGAIVFGGLAFYDGFVEPGMTVQWVGMIVETAFLALSVWSLAVRRPLALEYVPLPHGRNTAPFLGRTSYILTAVWALAFATMAAADAEVTFLHTIPPTRAALTGLAALAGALTFTWLSGVYIGRRLR